MPTRARSLGALRHSSTVSNRTKPITFEYEVGYERITSAAFRASIPARGLAQTAAYPGRLVPVPGPGRPRLAMVAEALTVKSDQGVVLGVRSN
jgi:hypothetical protein